MNGVSCDILGLDQVRGGGGFESDLLLMYNVHIIDYFKSVLPEIKV